MAPPLSSKVYVDGVYIPAALIVIGTAIVKRDWVVYSVALALALGTWKFFQLSK